MATLTRSLRDLYTFVSINSDWIPQLLEYDKTTMCGVPEFWSSFFQHIYGGSASSQDERVWDVLFQERRMMTAFRILLRMIARRGAHQLVQTTQ